MNATQKTAIEKAISTLEDLKSDIEPIATALREEHDELTEKQQESEKGQAIDSQATALEESLDEFDNLTTKLHESVES